MTTKELRIIELLYPNLSNVEIAEIIGISADSVGNYARTYGWKKSDGYYEKYRASTGRKRRVRENENESYNYWGMVKSFKQEQIERHGRCHPFYDAFQKQFKPKEN